MPLNVDKLDVGIINQGGNPVKPYKVYSALLNQSGTNAPVATVLENTLGGEIAWSRNGEGDYLGTLTGVFTVNKTVVFIQNIANSFETTAGSNPNDSVWIYVSTYDNDHGVDYLNQAPIEIRVYN